MGQYCVGVFPGVGRAASCLRQHLAVAKRRRDPCAIEVNQFFATVRREVVKYNAALAKGCAPELSPAGVCAGAAKGAAGEAQAAKPTQFACMLKHRARLTEACAAALLEEEI